MGGASGRKTFATFGDKLFGFPRPRLMDVTHHRTEQEFAKYAGDRSWEDMEAESFIPRKMALWGHGKYKPPLKFCVKEMVAEFQKQTENTLQAMVADLERTKALSMGTIVQLQNMHF